MDWKENPKQGYFNFPNWPNTFCKKDNFLIKDITYFIHPLCLYCYTIVTCSDLDSPQRLTNSAWWEQIRTNSTVPTN